MTARELLRALADTLEAQAIGESGFFGLPGTLRGRAKMCRALAARIDEEERHARGGVSVDGRTGVVRPALMAMLHRLDRDLSSGIEGAGPAVTASESRDAKEPGAAPIEPIWGAGIPTTTTGEGCTWPRCFCMGVCRVTRKPWTATPVAPTPHQAELLRRLKTEVAEADEADRAPTREPLDGIKQLPCETCGGVGRIDCRRPGHGLCSELCPTCNGTRGAAPRGTP